MTFDIIYEEIFPIAFFTLVFVVIGHWLLVRSLLGRIVSLSPEESTISQQDSSLLASVQLLRMVWGKSWLHHEGTRALIIGLRFIQLVGFVVFLLFMTAVFYLLVFR